MPQSPFGEFEAWGYSYLRASFSIPKSEHNGNQVPPPPEAPNLDLSSRSLVGSVHAEMLVFSVLSSQPISIALIFSIILNGMILMIPMWKTVATQWAVAPPRFHEETRAISAKENEGELKQHGMGRSRRWRGQTNGEERPEFSDGRWCGRVRIGRSQPRYENEHSSKTRLMFRFAFFLC